MSVVRIRRLQADYYEAYHLFQAHPHIRLVSVEGTPPEKYILEFHVPSLVPKGDTDFVRGDVHRAEIHLLLDYPRRPPFCRMVTPVFHPNIDPQKICIGDHWSAGQSLAHLIVRIGEMLCYQSYNVKSPLNARAAAWTAQNVDMLPLFKGDIGVGL